MHSIGKNEEGTLESPGQAEPRTEVDRTEASASSSFLDCLRLHSLRISCQSAMSCLYFLQYYVESVCVISSLCIMFGKLAECE